MNDTRTPPWAAALHVAQQKLAQGDSEGALTDFHAAAEGATLFGSAEGEMTARAGLAMALFGLGRAAEAVGPAKRAAVLAEQLGQKTEAALFRSLVQRLEEDQGEQARAPWFKALTAGQAALGRGDLDDAAGHLQTAADRARQAGAQGAEATACSLLAQTRLAQQRPDDALAPAKRALGIARALGQSEAVATFDKLVEAAETAQARLRRMAEMTAEAQTVIDQAAEGAGAAGAGTERAAAEGAGGNVEPGEGDEDR